MAAPDPTVHQPVLAERVVELLAPALQQPDAVLVDATLGLAGHAAALLRAAPQARLIGVDRDPDALAAARQRLAEFGERSQLVHARYDELPDVLAGAGLAPTASVPAILADLGVSSLQLDEVRRGFSYARDAPLDMRMDQSGGPTAADVLNTYSVGELTRVLRDFGEERFARRIAAAVVRERQRRPLQRTVELAELVRAAVPAPARRTGGHPAKRTFQALRIEVNGELSGLARFLSAALDALATPGGRIAVLSYHSLEDRLVKRALHERARPTFDPALPPGPGNPPPATLRLLTRGGEQPTEAEVTANPRAASARLRAAERLMSATPSDPTSPTSPNRSAA